MQLGDGRVWVEQVKIQTQPYRSEPSTGPLEELLDGLSELRGHPVKLREHGKPFEDLRSRLPAEFFQMPECPHFDDPGWLLGILDEVEAVLRGGLTSSGQDS